MERTGPATDGPAGDTDAGTGAGGGTRAGAAIAMAATGCRRTAGPEDAEPAAAETPGIPDRPDGPGRRGRPANLMTARRRQVLECCRAAAARGERLSLARIARACGMYDYRKVRRVLADLRRMGEM